MSVGTAIPRYPDMRSSGCEWLARVPSHWTVQPGFAVVREKSVSNADLSVDRVLSLSYGRIIDKRGGPFEGLSPASFATYQIVDDGDIIIRGTDLQNDKNSHRVGQVKKRGIITSAYICLNPTGLTSADYTYRLLDAYDRTKQLYRFGKGLRQNLSWSDFKRMPTLVPPAEEQAAIVRYLDHATAKLDRAVAAKRRAVKLLEEQKQAVIHRAVTRGVDPSAPPPTATTSDWFPEVPSGWSVTSLRRLVKSAIDGPHFSPNYVESGVPFLSARNIRKNGWILHNVKYVSRADYDEFCRRVTPEIGDVLYTKGGTTGVARVVDLDFAFQVWVHIAVLKVHRSLADPYYVAMLLNSPRCYEQSQLYTRGATNKDLGLGRMQDIVLPLPPSVEAQRSVYAEVDSAMRPILATSTEMEREIALLEEYRTALIAEVVTGQRDVRAAAAALPPLEDEAPDDALTDMLLEEAEDLAEAAE